MVQGTYPETASAPDSATAVSWTSRVSGRVRDILLPTQSDDEALVQAEIDDHGEASGSSHAWVGRLGRVASRLALVSAIVLLVASIGLFTFRAVYADKVYPAVVVGDVNVGGMTVEQAATALEERATELERGTVSFIFDGQTWTPTLSELGATIDVDTSVDAAYELGRDDHAVARLGFTNELLQDDQRVPLRTTVDRRVLASWFDSVNADIDQRAVDARLEVSGADVTITPEHEGIVVDESAATEMILGSLQNLESVSTELPTQVELPNIYASDLEGPRNDLAQALSRPMMAVFDNQTWEISAEELTEYLTVETVYENGQPDVQLAFEREAMTTYLREQFSGRVNRTPVDARIAWSYDAGGLIAVEDSVYGAALRANAFADAVAESFLSDQHLVDIPVVETRPEIDSNNLAALNIDGRLARATSNYAGGAASRDTNIAVGTQLMNGELIAPGEEFSFNGAVGEITYDKGFVDGGVIEAGIIGRSVGGGICQVVTTVFRAAILSGMPITEWWPHSLRLLGYERDGWTAGYDASILQSGSNPEYWSDFRFKNDTDGYMIVHSWNEYPYNIVEIYGQDDGRSVDVSDAQFADVGERWAAWFYRRVTYPDGTLVERAFESFYSDPDDLQS